MDDSLFEILPIIGGMVFSVIGAGMIGRGLVGLISTTRSNTSSTQTIGGLIQIVGGAICIFQSTRIGKFFDVPWLLPLQLLIAAAVLAGALRAFSPPGFADIRSTLFAPMVVGAVLFIAGLGWAGQLFKQGEINRAILVGAVGGGVGVVVLAFSLWRIMQEDSAAES